MLCYVMSKQWDSGRFSVSTGIIILFSQIVEFSGPISLHIRILILSFQTLEFWSYPFTHWNFSPTFINREILFFSFQTFKF